MRAHRVRRRKTRERLTDAPTDGERLEWAASAALTREMFRLKAAGRDDDAMRLNIERRNGRTVRGEDDVGWVSLDDGPTDADIAGEWLGPDSRARP
jgi:hypothetical protein